MAKRLRRPAAPPLLLGTFWLQPRASGLPQSLALLRRENSLPELPDLTMCEDIKRSAAVRRTEAESMQKSEDFGSLGERKRKKWVETEQELDALRRASRPRRKYGLSRSQSVAPATTSPPPSISLPQPGLFIDPEPDPAPCRIKKPLLRLFANLPKLPFGQHKSYNDVPDRSALFVPVKPTRRVRKVIGRPIKHA